MATEEFERGNVIRWRATFTDGTNPDAEPSEASITISYRTIGGSAAKATYEMQKLAGGVWIYDWDSSVAGKGVVEATARSTGGVVASKDKRINLLAMSSNVPEEEEVPPAP